MIVPSFYNTLGRERRPLETLEPGKVTLYTCGPTVYDHAHIGNLRTFVFEDVLRRALRHLGYEVHQVMNITDVDDKTIKRAGELGISLDEYTNPFTESFFEDLATLHVERAEEYPRATRHVPEMIALVEKLIENGHAYPSDGSIFFRIASDDDYGKLSGFDLDQVRQGERVADDEYSKEDPRDFVLWKGVKPGEPHWDSPWGPGRPGWHLECSAMSMKYLGETFDIHCGGVDNIFPHHENEIAQSESATGKPFARYWLHSKHLIVDGEKMSKSLGNFYTLKELLAKGAKPRAIRYLLLSVNYRKKLNFTLGGLDDAETALKRIDQMRFALEHAVEGEGSSDSDAGGEPDAPSAAIEAFETSFSGALADDLNVSKALAAVFDFVRAANKVIESGALKTGDKARILDALAGADQVLGVLDPDAWAPVPGKTHDPRPGADPDAGLDEAALSDADVDDLIQARKDARAAKNFTRADEIRDQLAAAGIVLEDTPQGTRWKRR